MISTTTTRNGRTRILYAVVKLRRQYRWLQHKISHMASSEVAPRQRVRHFLEKKQQQHAQISLAVKQHIRQQTPALRRVVVEHTNTVAAKGKAKIKSKSDSHSHSDSDSNVTGWATSVSDDDENPHNHTTDPTMTTWAREIYQQCQTIPNMLTLSRILMAPCISYWIVTDQMGTAGLACIVAGVTDVLDGQIAKRWPETQATALGTYLDPLADKILINTVACSLGWNGVLATPLVTLWMAKDVALMTATYWHVKAAIPHATSIWQVIDPVTVPLRVIPTTTSKLNTALQFATLATALYAGPSSSVFLTTLSWVTGTTTIMSVASYVDYSAFQPTSQKK